MVTQQTLSLGDVVYLYSCMESALETANGTNLTFDGNPAFYNGVWGNASAITLVPEPCTLLLIVAAGTALLHKRYRRN